MDELAKLVWEDVEIDLGDIVVDHSIQIRVEQSEDRICEFVDIFVEGAVFIHEVDMFPYGIIGCLNTLARSGRFAEIQRLCG